MEIRNTYVVAEFDDETGAWASLHLASEDGESVVRRSSAPFDLIIDGQRFFGRARREVRQVERTHDERGARFIFEREGLRVSHEAELAEDAPCLRQRVRIDVLAGSLRKLTEVHYCVPGLAIGSPADCMVQAPGQVIPPDSAYPRLARMPLDLSVSQPSPGYPQGWLEPAPDHTSGLVAVESPVERRVVSAWQYSEVATTFPTIDGDGEYIHVAHRHQLAAWLRPGDSLTSSEHGMLLTTGTFEEHLATFRRCAYGTRLASSGDTPEWLADAILLQIDPRPVSAWLERLPEIARLGFNLIYLMPVWSNQGNYYALTDHYAIDPRVGTETELREFVTAAHAHGLRVIFDFLPQGIGVLSPFIQEHPDWLVRDEIGRPFASHGWGPRLGAPAIEGTYSLDWGNLEYRKYAVDWAVWNVRTFGIDGFRTDALHWKEPGFSLDNPRPAWETMFGGVRLAEELRLALKRAKPDAILLSELWGPIFRRSHDATYENGWLLRYLNSGWLRGEPKLSGAQWARHLADAGDARPEGASRAFFSANHDSDRIARLARDSPLGDALSFTHAFSAGFPFLWYRELAEREEFFRTLLRQRKQLQGYTCSHRIAKPDSPALFTAYWTKDGKSAVLAVSNLSRDHVTSTVRLPAAPDDPTCIFDSGSVEIAPTVGGLNIDIPAEGYALIRS